MKMHQYKKPTSVSQKAAAHVFIEDGDQLIHIIIILSVEEAAVKGTAQGLLQKSNGLEPCKWPGSF